MTTETLLDNVNPNEPASYLTELVGDGKKFKTSEDLAKGKFMSDSMIETLKRQQDELRADYLKLKDESDSRARLETLIEQLDARKALSGNPPLVTDVKKEPVIDHKQIESLVSSEYQKQEQARKETDNFNLVKSKLKEQFGDKFPDVLKTQYENLGINAEYAERLARTAPEAFLRMVAPAPAQNFQTPPRSDVRTNQFAPNGGSKRTWSYYQELKAKNPKLYYDPKITIQMDRDSQELGSAFMDGDFYNQYHTE